MCGALWDLRVVFFAETKTEARLFCTRASRCSCFIHCTRRKAKGFPLVGVMPQYSFRVGQYNILANCLADNLKPWFWYGYAGIQKGAPYRDDAHAALRIKTFGYGRSQKLVEFWTLMKRFFKIFHTDFDYVLHLQNYDDDPGAKVVPLLHAALVAFFSRTNLSSPEGNKDLPYHLCQRDSKEYRIWSAVADAMGLSVPNDAWATLTQHCLEIERSEGVEDKCKAIEVYNRVLREALERQLVQSGREGQVLEDVLQELALFVCPSNQDLKNIFAVQDEWNWTRRSANLVTELQRHAVDVWAIEELDELQQFRQQLATGDNGSCAYELAVFKYRAITPKEDGAGIFYNPQVFRVKAAADGKPLVGCVRFSGAAAVAGKASRLQRISLGFQQGLIVSENEDNERWADRAKVTAEPLVPAYVFTDQLTPNDKEFFDERIAVFAILQHIGSGLDIAVVATHLYHSQNNVLHENIRAQEARQLSEALDAFRCDTGLSHAPALLLGDLNDAPDVSYYGRPAGATPMYRCLLEEGWVDQQGPHRPPTTLTLQRQLPIDYVLLKPSVVGPDGQAAPQLSCEVDPPQRVRLVACAMCGCELLPEGEVEGAVFGPPLRAVGGQPPIPSDHVAVTATVHFNLQGLPVP